MRIFSHSLCPSFSNISNTSESEKGVRMLEALFLWIAFSVLTPTFSNTDVIFYGAS